MGTGTGESVCEIITQDGIKDMHDNEDMVDNDAVNMMACCDNCIPTQLPRAEPDSPYF